ncbi:MAG: DEAD/DEAH box helicase [Oscillospiraceae bacterium]
MKFEDLNLQSEILKAISQEGYETPSPIQEKAIPPALEGRDVLGCAQTGTGKTAAFALPILQNILKNPIENNKPRKIRALVLTPTRELALQIAESFQTYGRYTDINCMVIFGGVSANPQIAQLRDGTDILIATPGRLNDLINQKEVDLNFVETFVLDEADRMLDMGFVHDVKKIIARVPRQRQTLFFSATMPPEITSMVASILKNPAKVTVTPVSSTVDVIEQSVYFVDKVNKQKLLIHLLKDKTIVSALVFTRTKHGADKVVKELEKASINAQAIHGNKSQSARVTALANFKSGQTRVLVATDIAARGIDIDELSHVFNYDVPNISETYVHRIGRTGRAGLGGIAISFCDIEEKPYLADIEKLIGKRVPVVKEHPYPMTIFTIEPKVKQERPKPRTNANKFKKEAQSGKSTKSEKSGKPGKSEKFKPYSPKKSPIRSQSTNKAPAKKGHVKKG